MALLVSRAIRAGASARYYTRADEIMDITCHRIRYSNRR
ncbi:hypothetical protein EBME_1469 [bacterium endosymbiont of Mortierella elongata FMR23-6]|nr:hypothetical protein EBME_1469 [bacterium endosymbiont of Mortierella elongata FMR23-6]